MLIDDITIQQQADILSGYLPGDKLHLAKNKVATNEEGTRVPFRVPARVGTLLDNLENSNLRKLINGLAGQFKDFKTLVNSVYDDFNPLTTTGLLTEWEGALDFPDTIFTNTTNDTLRRIHLAIRLASLNAVTSADFVAIGAAAGLSITVGPKLSGVGAKETVVVEIDTGGTPSGLPLTLPFVLGDNLPNQLIDLFETLIPAQCELEVTFI